MKHRVSISAAEARRIALAAQGFDRERPANPDDVRHYRRVMRDITVLQLDYVNVVLPAHFMMIWSRLGAYDRQRFERWLYDSGEHTEQWAHEASVVSVEDWPLLQHRRDAFQMHKNSPLRKLNDRAAYLDEVLATAIERGPVSSNDVPARPGVKRKDGDWHRSMARSALENHFGCGRLAVRKRERNFQRVYDLPERLLPQSLLARAVEKEDAQREMLRKSARALGVATLHDLADYYRMPAPDARPRLEELVEEGTLVEVSVEGWQAPGFVHHEAGTPRSINGASILSPFDPVVWYRDRAQRMYGFEYRIEIYVPAAKRRWGYYVLPFREGDRITARIDLKADRKASCLRVQAAFAEGCASSDTPQLLATELRQLADWLQLETVSIKKASTFDKALARLCS